MLTDHSYARLLDQLARHNFEQITPQLRNNILAFYADPAAPLATRRKAAAWEKTQGELERLKAVAPSEGAAVEKRAIQKSQLPRRNETAETLFATFTTRVSLLHNSARLD